MLCMSEWTSLSVKQETRDRFNEEKEQFNEGQDDSLPDLSTDQFMQMLLDTRQHAQEGGYSDADNSESIDTDELVNRISDELDITVEMSEDEKTAKVLADRLIDRLKGIDEDVRNAAYEGSKEAIQEVAR